MTEQVTQTKTKGHVSDFFVESILVDGKPKFLAYEKTENKLVIRESILYDGLVKPLKESQCGYVPYSFTEDELDEINTPISKEELLDEIKSHVDKYVVTDDLTRHLIQIDILLSYCQEWVTTLHFPFSVGDTESGKSTILHLASWLCYRCHLGEDIPSADVYNFLGKDEEACGTIAEDEAQGLHPNSEKLRMYKSSYSKGSKKARILGTDSLGKHQVFYKTFCQKWFAGEKIPNDKGFVERLAVIHMMSGIPKGNIKKLSSEEKKSLQQLRNKLLVWKLQNVMQIPTPLNSKLKNRDAELWDDFISTTIDTKYFDKANQVAQFYISQRQEGIKNSIVAKLFQIISSNLDKNYQIKALDLWNLIIHDNLDLPGTLDQSQRTFYPDEFGTKITMNKLASILEQTFHAKKKHNYVSKNNKYHKITSYVLSKDLITAFAVKYGINTSGRSSQGSLMKSE